MLFQSGVFFDMDNAKLRPVSDYFVAKKCGDVPKLRYANIQLGVTCCFLLTASIVFDLAKEG